MIQTISINPHQVKDYTCVTINAQGMLNGFPFLSIDRDSYLVSVEIQSGINFDPASGRHCVAMGKCCSLAESITFMIDINHDYKSVCQGELTCLEGVRSGFRITRKGSILLQNDVWIGHGATIMSGVTLHNGCVVAAESMVTKDAALRDGGRKSRQNPGLPVRRGYHCRAAKNRVVGLAGTGSGGPKKGFSIVRPGVYRKISAGSGGTVT